MQAGQARDKHVSVTTCDRSVRQWIVNVAPLVMWVVLGCIKFQVLGHFVQFSLRICMKDFHRRF